MPHRPLKMLAAFALLVAPLACSKHSTPTAPIPGPLENVSGTVRWSDGQPADGIPVSLLRKLFPPPAPGDTLYSTFTFTDTLGHFGFSEVPKGTFGVFAAAFSPDVFPPIDTLVAAVTVTLARNGMMLPPLDLRLRPGGTFTGMVRDSASGQPVEAFIFLDGTLNLSGSDTTGVYELTGVPPGSWTVLGFDLVDSVTILRGHVAGVMPSPVTTVTLPDLRVGYAPLVPATLRAAIARARELRDRQLRAIRERQLRGPRPPTAARYKP